MTDTDDGTPQTNATAELSNIQFRLDCMKTELADIGLRLGCHFPEVGLPDVTNGIIRGMEQLDGLVHFHRYNKEHPHA